MLLKGLAAGAALLATGALATVPFNDRIEDEQTILCELRPDVIGHVSAKGDLLVLGVGYDANVYVAEELSRGTTPAVGAAEGSASKVSQFTQWQTLDGPTASYPTVVALGGDAGEALLIRGQDRQAYIKVKSGESTTGWGLWRSLGGDFSSRFTSFTDARGRAVLLGRDAEGYLTAAQQTEPGKIAFSTWERVTDAFNPADVPVVSHEADGRVNVLVVGVDGYVYSAEHNADAGENEASFSEFLHDDTLRVSGHLATSTTNEGHILVFAKAENKQVYVRRQIVPNKRMYTGWFNLGGVAYSSPRVVRRADGTNQLFVRSFDGSIWTRQTSFSDGWAPWTRLGATSLSAPKPLVDGDDNVHVLVYGLDGEIRHNMQAPGVNSTWAGWSSLGMWM